MTAVAVVVITESAIILVDAANAAIEANWVSSIQKGCFHQRYWIDLWLTPNYPFSV